MNVNNCSNAYVHQRHLNIQLAITLNKGTKSHPLDRMHLGVRSSRVQRNTDPQLNYLPVAYTTILD